MKKILLIISTVLLLFTYGIGQAQEDANSMNELLLQIEHTPQLACVEEALNLHKQSESILRLLMH